MVKPIGSIGPEKFTDDDLKDVARVEKALMEKLLHKDSQRNWKSAEMR